MSVKDGRHTLYGRSRDAEAFEVAIEFQKEICRWRVLGDRSQVERDRDRGTIIAALSDAVEMTTADLVAAVGKSRSWVMKLLASMVASGEICKASHGHYALPIKSKDPPGSHY